jgi:AcrR family transcriptional regulator
MPKRGRPRNEAATQAIAAAVRDLLHEVGYRGLSMERVARRAGVAKTTLYRRAPDLPHLVFDVLFRAPPPLPEPAASWQDTLKGLVATLSEVFADPIARSAMPGLLSNFSAEEGLANRVRSELLAPAYAVLDGWLQAHTDHAPEERMLIVDALFGAVFVRALLFDRPVDRSVTDALVDRLV